MPRLFIACELPSLWLASLQACCLELKRRLGAEAGALRWVRPEGIHLTLHFLGETPPGDEPRIVWAMTAAAAQTRPFSLTLRGLGTFGGRRPRVLWAGIDGDVAALSALQGQVTRVLGVYQPDERFAPHLTLARVPQPERGRAPRTPPPSAEVLDEIIRTSVPRDPGPWRVDNLTLVQSDLLPGGARYTTRHVAPLTGD